ncbi:hypothetical protein ACLOJK_007482 [Asimina triloba]
MHECGRRRRRGREKPASSSDVVRRERAGEKNSKICCSNCKRETTLGVLAETRPIFPLSFPLRRRIHDRTRNVQPPLIAVGYSGIDDEHPIDDRKIYCSEPSLQNPLHHRPAVEKSGKANCVEKQRVKPLAEAIKAEKSKGFLAPQRRMKLRIMGPKPFAEVTRESDEAAEATICGGFVE